MNTISCFPVPDHEPSLLKTICFNEDNEHFYATHPPEDMTRRGCRALVDAYARTGTIRSLLFRVNLQRALYDSEVWERFRDLPPDTQYVRNLRLLADRGVDQFAEWLARCRETGIEGWLSMRMNDAHGLKEAVRGIPSRLALWRSKRWEEHPEWRRAPWRDERSWKGAFDWSHKEVRDHALALVREILGRWDLFGLDLDWMRWGMFFRPGSEVAGRALPTEFVGDVRRLADEAAARLGHPVLLAHRVPVTPEACPGLGFDVAAWARLGAVDMLTLSGFGNDAFPSPPVALWRCLLRPGTRVNVAVGPVATPHAGSSVVSHEILRGSAAVAWAADADGAYFFNECYREPDQMDILERDLRAASSPAGVAADTRRIAVSASLTVAPLTQRFVGTDFSRMEQNTTFKLSAGELAEGTDATLELAFDEAAAAAPDAEAALCAMDVRVNCEPVVPCGGAGAHRSGARRSGRHFPALRGLAARRRARPALARPRNAPARRRQRHRISPAFRRSRFRRLVRPAAGAARWQQVKETDTPHSGFFGEQVRKDIFFDPIHRALPRAGSHAQGGDCPCNKVAFRA